WSLALILAASGPLLRPQAQRRALLRVVAPVLGDVAGIDAQVKAGDHHRVVRAEEDGRLAVVAGRRQPAQRDLRGKRVEGRRQLAEARRLVVVEAPAPGTLDRLVRVGGRRRQAVDADGVRRKLHGHGAREVEQTGLAGAVTDVADVALVRLSRGDVDDRAL